MKSILDPTFRYTPSFATDIRKTFKRARTESLLREIGYCPATVRGIMDKISVGGDAMPAVDAGSTAID